MSQNDIKNAKTSQVRDKGKFQKFAGQQSRKNAKNSQVRGHKKNGENSQVHGLEKYEKCLCQQLSKNA